MEDIEKVKNALVKGLDKETEEYNYLYNLKDYNLEQVKTILKNLNYKEYSVAKNWCIVGEVTLNKVFQLIKSKFKEAIYEPTMESIVCRLEDNDFVSIVVY